jgi:D-lactate dehydrogenase
MVKKVLDKVVKKMKKSLNNKETIKIAFFELEGWEKEMIKKELSNLPNVKLYFSQDVAKPGDYDIISIFIYSKIDKEFIDKCPNLKLIVSRSAGLDHIDLEYAKKRGIKVKNCPSYGPHSVAEHSFLLLLAVIRNLRKTLEEEYNFSAKDVNLRGFELKGKTIGIIGTGKIGSVACEIALGFGMKVLAYDKFPKQELIEKGVIYKNFEDILKEADILSFYVPLLPETKHMLNKDNIKLLKNGVVIVNVSRGPVIEMEALLEGLKSGKIKGVGLDVMEGEKTFKVCEMKGSEALELFSKEELIKFGEIMELMHKFKDKVLITPHIAYNTWESVNNIWKTSLDHIKDFLNK